MTRSVALLFAVAALSLACHAQQGQQAQTGPSLQETFDWITHTLKPTEGNNAVIHRPNQRPYPKEWVEKRIDPYHQEVIEKFSHDGCRVEFDVNVTDNDMALLLGKYLVEHDVETFDLKGIDPTSVRVQNSCEPIDTPQGATTPWNCQDTQGKVVIFQTSNAEAKIHEERSGSSGKSPYGWYEVNHAAKYNLDEMCKEANAAGDVRNSAYCDVPEHKEEPVDKTSSTLGFSTPEYAKRFIKAFRHAVELCGGKPSTF